MRKVHGLFMVVLTSALVLTGCAGKSQTSPAKVATERKNQSNAQRACFSTAETMTCIQRTVYPNGTKKVEMLTIPLSTIVDVTN